MRSQGKLEEIDEERDLITGGLGFIGLNLATPTVSRPLLSRRR